MQLVAYGAQDVFLTGNPEITFYKAVHKRHTNFAMETIEQTFNGTADFGNQVKVTIARNGDLVMNMYLLATISAKVNTVSAKWAWIKNLGNSIIDYVELKIGGQTIDKHYGEWLNIWHELSASDEHGDSWDVMMGNSDTANSLAPAASTSAGDRSTKVYVPLQFWFNRNPGLALPLIALQYHEVEVNFNFVTGSSIYHVDNEEWSAGSAVTVTPKIDSAKLLVNYIYLDTEEIKRFAQSPHEYLIEQTQDKSGGYTSGDAIPASTATQSVDLYWNHPVKSLYWVVTQNKYTDSTKQFLGNDQVSCTKNFIIRYCLSNITSTTYTLSGSRISIGIDDQKLIVLQTQSDDSTLGQSSSLSDMRIIHGTNKLNSAGTYYQDIIEVLSAAHIGWNVPAAQTEGTLTSIDLTTTLWNSIHVPKVLPAALCALDINSTDGIEAVGTATGNIFESAIQAKTIGGTSGNGTTVKLNLHHHFGTNIDGSGQTIDTALLKLNGQDRFSSRDAAYFNSIVPWESHMNTPSNGIYVYSFALNPEDQQPSGTCNFSRIDNAQLSLKMITSNLASRVKLYALNYNVLRITSGMGGLAYSN